MKKFLHDVKIEFDKVTWPTKQELKDSTLVTLAVTAVFTVYIYLADNIISFGVRFLYGLN